MSKSRVLVQLVVLAAGAVGAWWWFFSGAEKPVTEAEARRYLDRIVAAAQARDFERLCGLN